jgi:hypothetical protein
MALPLILSLLGSGLAGAGALGGLGILGSPLIAGAIGSGLGTVIQEKDLGAGIRSGLIAGALGGLGGALTGGAAGAGGGTGLLNAAPEGTQAGIRGMLSRMPSGFSGPTDPTAFNKFMAARGTSEAMAFPFRDVMREGLNQGVLTGAGIGAALPGAMQAMTPTMPEIKPQTGPGREPVPFNREARRAPAGFRPGIDPEFQYFRPTSVPVPRLAAGGMLNYTPAGMDQPMRMQAGGIADMMPGAEREAAPMNDKDIVAESIRAIRGELPEQEAAIVLGQFLQTYGEEAFRKLVDDVQSGRAGAGGDMEGTVQGPGDGMDDLVPATMDDGSQDVLLSDGEFIVPADVVSGLGNGSTDAGAEELHRMMDRVRQERTGRKAQAPQVAAGGLMPA